MKTAIKNTLMVLATLLVFFILLEVMVRTGENSACYAYPEGLFEPDEQLCYKLSAEFEGKMISPEFSTTLYTNSLGIRNNEIGEKTSARRVLVLGDSFTTGIGVEQEETFSAVLETLLDKEGDYEVINAGVPSYDTWRERNYLKRNAEKLEPDIVIVAFFNNDINGNEYENTCSSPIRKGYLVDDSYMKMPLPLFNLRIFVNTKVQSYCLIKNSAFNVKSRFRKHDTEKSIQGSLLTYFTNEPYQGKTAENWNTTKRILSEVMDLTEESGSELIILIIPDNLQAEEAVWKPITARYGITSKDFDMEKLNRLIKEFGEENNIVVIDPLPELREATKTKKLYYYFDRHLNVEGNRIVAETIYNNIISN